MTGLELKQLRNDLGEAIGRPLSAAGSAGFRRLVGPTPSADGKSPVQAARHPNYFASWRWRAIVTRSLKTSTYSIASIFPKISGMPAERNFARRCGMKFAGVLSKADRRNPPSAARAGRLQRWFENWRLRLRKKGERRKKLATLLVGPHPDWPFARPVRAPGDRPREPGRSRCRYP
jgi:hypothetical protein